MEPQGCGTSKLSDVVWETSVTRWLSTWGKGDGDANRHRGAYNQPQVRIENRYTYRHCEAIIKVLARNK